jgi:hypothetical protein
LDAIWLLERYAAEHNKLVHARAQTAAHRNGTGPSLSRLLALFAPDAEMVFEGVTVGPFQGTAEIGRAFKTAPPDDTLIIGSVYEVGDRTATGEYRWSATPAFRAGSLTVFERDGYISRIIITVKRRQA